MIYVVCGAVKSGKTKMLIDLYEDLKEEGAKVFSSKFSLNQGESVKSRYGSEIKAIAINSLFDIPHHIINKDIKAIFIDEFQFLQMSTNELKAFFDEYYYKYNFYLFGLDMDYRRYPFKLMGSVMAMADEVIKIHGYCDICGHVPSKYSLRLENGNPANIEKEGQVILLDGKYEDVKIEYKSICNKCWKSIYNKD